MRIALQGEIKGTVAWWITASTNSSTTPNSPNIILSVCCTPLQELSQGVESSSHTSHGDVGHVGDGGTGAAGAAAGRRAGGRGSTGGTRLAVGSGGVGGGGLAHVLATDHTVALHLLELAALELAVSALQVEATVDLLEGVHVDTGVRY